jgi:hypothetical protein
VADWAFLTGHARVLLCIARDPGVRLCDIAARTGVTERTAYGIVTDLTEAGHVVKHEDVRPFPAGRSEPAATAVSGMARCGASAPGRNRRRRKPGQACRCRRTWGPLTRTRESCTHPASQSGRPHAKPARRAASPFSGPSSQAARFTCGPGTLRQGGQ